MGGSRDPLVRLCAAISLMFEWRVIHPSGTFVEGSWKIIDDSSRTERAGVQAVEPFPIPSSKGSCQTPVPHQPAPAVSVWFPLAHISAWESHITDLCQATLSFRASALIASISAAPLDFLADGGACCFPLANSVFGDDKSSC